MDISVNYWAVLISAVAYMAIGSLWYGPFFGKPWMRMMGITPEDMKRKSMPNGMTPAKSMIAGMVLALVMALVLAHEAFVWGEFAVGLTPFMLALNLAFWLWLGFIATTQMGSVLWEGRPWRLYFINASFSFTAMLSMSLILVYWM